MHIPWLPQSRTERVTSRHQSRWLPAVSGLALGTLLMLGTGGASFAQGVPPAQAFVGTVTAVTAATSTTPEEITVTSSANSAETFAVDAQTQAVLMAPGLDTMDVILPVGTLAVGEAVAIEPAQVTTNGLYDIATIWVQGTVAVGQVTASPVSGSTDIFTMETANGSLTVTDAETGAQLPAVGTDLAAYGLPTGAGSLTAYLVDTTPLPVTGTIASPTTSASGGSFILNSDAGSLPVAYTTSTQISLGTQSTVPSAYLLAGAQATVTYEATAQGAVATTIALAPTTVTGTLSETPQVNNSVTTFTVTTSAGTVVPVTALTATQVSGGSLTSAAVGSPITATGVEIAGSLIAVTVSLGTAATPTPPPVVAVPPSGTVHGTLAAVTGTSATIDTEDGPFTFAWTSSTTVTLADTQVPASDLAPGQTLTVGYTAAASAGSLPTATSVHVEAQSLRGVVTAVTSQTAFTVVTPEGTAVSVTLVTPSVTGSQSDQGQNNQGQNNQGQNMLRAALAVGTTVEALGLDEPGDSFLAVAFSAQEPHPESVHGTITDVTSTSVTLAPEGHGRAGLPDTLLLTDATVVDVAGVDLPIAALAAGEVATVQAVPDSSQAGMWDAHRIILRPTRLKGVVETVSTTSSGTVLTVLVRGGHLPPIAEDRGGKHGKGGPNLPVVQVAVFPATVIQAHGVAGFSGIAQGDMVNVLGAWSPTAQELMAARIDIMPGHIALPQRGRRHGR